MCGVNRQFFPVVPVATEVYGVQGVAEMQQVVRRAACSSFTNADGIWVLEEGGNGVLPGYTTMPSYFAQQVDFVKTAIAPECAPTVYTQAPTGGSCWFNPSDLNCELWATISALGRDVPWLCAVCLWGSFFGVPLPP